MQNDSPTHKLRDIKPIDAHDRLLEVRKTADKISDGLRDAIRLSPFTKMCEYLYVHSHKRQADFPGDPDRLIWHGRLSKPPASTNSMLFKIYVNQPDDVFIKWIIPPREQWHLYQKGMMFENETVINSIHDFEKDRKKLEAPDPDDLNDEQIRIIYKELLNDMKVRKLAKKVFTFMNDDTEEDDEFRKFFDGGTNG